MTDASYLAQLERPRLCRVAGNLHFAVHSLMKLTAAQHILNLAELDGTLLPRGHIVETTSGTFGLALALLASARGYRLTLVTASSLIDDRFTSQLALLGTELVVVDDPAASGNQDGRLRVLSRILDSDRSAFWPRQYDNPENRNAYASLADAAIKAIGRIDILVGTVGTGGSLFGAGRSLRDAFPTLRIVAVDTHRSVLFGHEAGRRMLRGLGNSIVPANVLHDMVDEVHWVGALPAFVSTRSLYKAHGIFAGPTSGAAALVATWTAAQFPDARVLAIFPDEGHRYRDTVYSDVWISGLPGWPIELPSEPIVLDAIEPFGESEWTCYPWARRTLAQASGA